MESCHHRIPHLKSLKNIFIFDEKFSGLCLESTSNLRNLEGLPEKIEYLDINIDEKFSFKGCPKEIKNGNFAITNNNIVIYDIEYFPKIITSNSFYNFRFYRIFASLKKMKHFTIGPTATFGKYYHLGQDALNLSLDKSTSE